MPKISSKRGNSAQLAAFFRLSPPSSSSPLPPLLIFHFRARAQRRQTGNICEQWKLKLTLSDGRLGEKSEGLHRRATRRWALLSGNVSANSRARYNFTRPATLARKNSHCLQTVFAYSTPAFSFAASVCSRNPSRCHPLPAYSSPCLLYLLVRLALIPSSHESRLCVRRQAPGACKCRLRIQMRRGARARKGIIR